jgi:hypothetical protein
MRLICELRGLPNLAHRRRFVVPLAVILLLAGCFTRTITSPVHWAEPRRTDSPCRDIAGVYANLGETSERRSSPEEVRWCPNLADALVSRVHIAGVVQSPSRILDERPPPALVPRCEQCVTELRWLNAELTELHVIVRQTDDGQDVSRILSASSGDFRCSPQGLEVSYFEAKERIGHAMYAKGRRLFAPTSDGALLMTETATSFARVTFVLPLGMDFTFSARWMPHRERPAEDVERPRTESPAAQVAPLVCDEAPAVRVDERVNCMVGGERRWTYRSKCD